MLHPIVEQQSPSPEQVPAIAERGRDVVVTAGAGTGKTRTLVARYLALLSEGLPLRAIIAITFTQKAAREMRNRVREAMRRYLQGAGLSEVEHRHWQQRYSELDAARISTIHSLCSEILRAHPAEAGFDPRFEVLDEGQANLLQGQVIDEALARAADTPALVPLFAILGERELRDTLTSLLRRRLETTTSLARLPANLMSHWAQHLRRRQQRGLEALVADEAWSKWVAILRDNPATKPEDLRELQRQQALAAIDEATGSLAEQLASLARLGRINLKGGSAKSWPGGKEQAAEVKAALTGLRDLWRRHAALLSLELTTQDERLAQAVPLLRHLFEFMADRYTNFKQERGVLDFDDLEAEALQLLEKHPAIQTRWQQQIQAILTDEFQDTNDRQRDLLALLNGDGGKLFVVGDAKQSIYRFRGADVTVFREERLRIEAEGGRHVALDTSYRAHEQLLEGLNDLLRPVLGEQADPARPWVEPFGRLAPHRLQAGRGFAAPYLELHLTVGRKGAGALKRAASALVNNLIELVETGETEVGLGDNSRPLSYGDMAILCRASTSFAAYEDALEQAGVPFLTVAGRGFYHRPEIRDLLNALQALADPTDDLALAGLLRSPALALTDETLFRLHQARQSAAPVSLWEALSQSGATLTTGDNQRQIRAVEIVQRLHQQVGRVSVADLLKAFLDMTDYRAALIEAGQKRAARNVAKLLADAHTSGIVGVGEFLEYVLGLRDSGTREGEARATAEGVVQLMTVHAAKGLEFPIVVIGDVTYRLPQRNGLLLDPELGLLLPQKDGLGMAAASYRLGKLQADDQEQAESDRLLYVAATRAQEKLMLSGCIELSKNMTPARLSGWLGQLAGAEVLGLAGTPVNYNDAGATAIELRLQVGRTPVACAIYEPEFSQAVSKYRETRVRELPTPLPPPLLGPISTDLGQEKETPISAERSQRVWRVVPTVERPRAPAWVVGKLVHSALAAWRFPDDRFEAWLEAQARSTGLIDERQLKDAVRETQRLLRRFQEHPLYQAMDRAKQRRHEVPYSLMIDGELENGIIDALFLTSATWTIVEFKTDAIRAEAELEATLIESDYRSQVRRYAEAVKRTHGQEPRAILCWLNYRDGVKITEVEVVK
jgi:ATP-dependent helicase/nuclease subunit A